MATAASAVAVASRRFTQPTSTSCAESQRVEVGHPPGCPSFFVHTVGGISRVTHRFDLLFSCSRSWFDCGEIRLEIMASPKKRIPVDGPQIGLNAAFAGLDIAGLPEGPASVPLAAHKAESKRPGRVVLRRSTAHRGGKTVVVVDGFGPQHSEEAIESLGRRIRAACGCGGTARDRTLEIQGDQLGRVRSALEAEGFVVGGER